MKSSCVYLWLWVYRWVRLWMCRRTSAWARALASLWRFRQSASSSSSAPHACCSWTRRTSANSPPRRLTSDALSMIKTHPPPDPPPSESYSNAHPPHSQCPSYYIPTQILHIILLSRDNSNWINFINS